MSQDIKKGTVLSALMWAANELKGVGIVSFRLDAELLLSYVLNLSRVQLYLNFDRPMNRDEKERFLALVNRRKEREPLAYIVNQKEFFSLTFYVDQRVLIPRPETECLVEWILKNVSLSSDSRVIDIGTGSGCIAISILKNSNLKGIYASDVSEEALSVARRNFELHLSDKAFYILKSSFFENIFESDFDLVVSNPPYLKREVIRTLPPEISRYEPLIALDGGESGEECIYRLIEEAHPHLKAGGLLVFEHGDEFDPDMNIIGGRYELFFRGKDYSGKNRFVVLKRL